jgi:two-component system OmpR family response regulator
MVPDDQQMETTAKDSGAAVKRVLVVDDEPAISELLMIALRYEGFEVAAAATGAEALERFEEFRPQIILLDVMLPDLDGFEVARRLAERRSEVPIIFLTARDTTEDKVRGLSLGGDDYVTKPFSIEELVARIRTILRRTGVVEDEGRLVYEGIELDEDTREVFRDGDPVDLTDTEFRLLRYLMLNPRRALTRSQILDHVWNYDFGGDGRVLETYISYLRRKVDRPERPLIHTVRGVGYSLRRARS